MDRKTCALHIHRWGSPWTDGYHLYPLSPTQLSLMYTAYETIDPKYLQGDEFLSLRTTLSNLLSSHPILFFRLSCCSAKDVPYDSFGPFYKINSIDRLFSSICQSLRIADEIRDQFDRPSSEKISRNESSENLCRKEDYVLAFRSWNEDITAERERRLLIVERKLVAVILPSQKKIELEGEVFERLREYVERYKERLPEETLAMDVAVKGEDVVFIEFNPLDEQLDTFEADLTKCQSSLLSALAREEDRFWLK